MSKSKNRESPGGTTAAAFTGPNVARFSTTSKDFDERQSSNTPLPNMDGQEATPTLMERSDKNVFSKFFDKYSLSQQTNRILMAESFLQAASSQASDP